MAERRSTYVFQRESDFEDAKDHIYREMSGDYYDSDKIEFYGFWGSCSKFDWERCYRIDIYSECSDAPHAADIFREHRGRYIEI